jgi:long-chain acyl-CoA synthetase
MHSYDQPSIGSAIYGCDVDVLDTTGAPTAEGCEGELVVKGANVMLGYWGRAEYTTEAIGGEYLRTGDLGSWRMIGGRKMFFVTGRAKDLIIRCGEKVSPASVEAAMGQFGRKHSILAVGFKNCHVGEEIGLYVQAEYTPALVRELRLALGELSITLRPRAVIVGNSEVPRTSTGKPQRAKLRPLFISLGDQPHSHAHPTIMRAPS